VGDDDRGRLEVAVAKAAQFLTFTQGTWRNRTILENPTRESHHVGVKQLTDSEGDRVLIIRIFDDGTWSHQAFDSETGTLIALTGGAAERASWEAMERVLRQRGWRF
jgi:hypothetical protein